MIARGSIDKSIYKLCHKIYTIYNFYRPVLLHNNFDRVDESFKIRHAGSRIHKFHQLFQKLLVKGGGGALHLRLLFCRIVSDDKL